MTSYDFVCLRCGKLFPVFGEGTQWRHDDEDEPGDAQVRCKHCGYWASPDLLGRVTSVDPEPDDPDGYGEAAIDAEFERIERELEWQSERT